ncbi:DUF1804 domain-containing protein [Candidatus Ornithobacterium hominis]|uniref:terminase gpP N-terminus-related DNA-binding protein n=1 Tax=Candidatus Ornithobacterium hominis TaxID=2497989 RepID=UPI0024BD016F|nr:hypothetical protein [Candidatus Ornithobacterium hominis]CAI9429256.1 DUF1804 domain-containing protein [Candidatus Ornithobacterium hominis]
MAKTQTRIKAEAFYIENLEITLKEVAEHYKVSQNTVSSWAKKYDWENKRLNFHASPTKIKQLLQQELLQISEGKKPKLPADAIAKLMATLDRLEKKADPVVVHKILKDLDHFIAEINPDFATQCTTFHKQFLQHRISLEN